MSATNAPGARGRVVSLDARRALTIGGSEAAAACGVDPHRSRIMLWAEKTGRAEVVKTEAMKWGRILEPVVRDELTARGFEITTLPFTEWTHDARPWLTGHPDGFVMLDGDQAVLEIKTGSAFTSHDWANEIGAPVPALMQVHHYMELTGLHRGLLACLVGGQRLELRTVVRDQAVIDAMLSREEKFLGYVRSDTPPPPDGTDSARDALRALHPVSDGSTVRLDSDTYGDVRRLRLLREQRAEIERQETELTQRIQLAMGDAEIAVSPFDTPAAKWANVNRTQLDTKALRAERPDVYAEFAALKSTRRFTVE